MGCSTLKGLHVLGERNLYPCNIDNLIFHFRFINKIRYRNADCTKMLGIYGMTLFFIANTQLFNFGSFLNLHFPSMFIGGFCFGGIFLRKRDMDRFP